jgi:general secretion pathway protein D
MEVGVILEVTPVYNADDQTISLNGLNPRVVELDQWIDYGYDVPIVDPQTLQMMQYHLSMPVPIFARREVMANVTIYNGATVVMGGLITEQRIKIEDKTPLLGDIPYLGRLFRSTVEQSQKRNLLIFVTARLVGYDGRPKEEVVVNTGFETLAVDIGMN